MKLVSSKQQPFTRDINDITTFLGVHFQTDSYLKIRWMFVSDKFYNQGLVLNGRPNLKLFNQLYWLITLASLLVGHVVFPLPQLISGTFPSQSRYRPNNTIFITSPWRRGRICLLRAIHPDFESENKGVRQRLILLISTLLLMLFIWHFYAKVSPLML